MGAQGQLGAEGGSSPDPQHPLCEGRNETLRTAFPAGPGLSRNSLGGKAGKPFPRGSWPSKAIMVPSQAAGWLTRDTQRRRPPLQGLVHPDTAPTSDEPRAEAVMEGRDQGEAGASRVCARTCVCPCSPCWLPAERGRPSQAPRWCPDHPFLPGPRSLFSEPEAAWAVGTQSWSPWVGVGGGRWPSRPRPPPAQCCFPLWGSQGLFEDIYFHSDYFTLDADFFGLYF